jgi:hypothetical protein
LSWRKRRLCPVKWCKSRTSSLSSTTAWTLPQPWTERAPSTAAWKPASGFHKRPHRLRRSRNRSEDLLRCRRQRWRRELLHRFGTEVPSLGHRPLEESRSGVTLLQHRDVWSVERPLAMSPEEEGVAPSRDQQPPINSHAPVRWRGRAPRAALAGSACALRSAIRSGAQPIAGSAPDRCSAGFGGPAIACEMWLPRAAPRSSHPGWPRARWSPLDLCSASRSALTFQ